MTKENLSNCTLEIQMEPQVLNYLDYLRNLGLWGETREEVAAALMCDALKRLFASPGFGPPLRDIAERIGAPP